MVIYFIIACTLTKEKEAQTHPLISCSQQLAVLWLHWGKVPEPMAFLNAVEKLTPCCSWVLLSFLVAGSRQCCSLGV